MIRRAILVLAITAFTVASGDAAIVGDRERPGKIEGALQADAALASGHADHGIERGQ